MSNTLTEMVEDRSATKCVNKPAPLVLNKSQASTQRSAQPTPSLPLSEHELLQLMQVICAAVRANQLTTNLAGHIVRVCDQLKHVGQHMDIHHAAAMNNVFTALRQASYRDVNSLGMTCRLRIMETVELRAAGWHSQHYPMSPPQSGRMIAPNAVSMRAMRSNYGNTVPSSAPP